MHNVVAQGTIVGLMSQVNRYEVSDTSGTTIRLW